MKPATNIFLATGIALVLCGCGTPNKTNLRSKENTPCTGGEVMVCRGAYASKLDDHEPEDDEFCTCQPKNLPISQL